MIKPKLLFYCQHLLGVGHLTRSLAISEGLVETFEVTFIQGGPDIGKTLKHSSFKHVFLSPLLMRESDSSLYDPQDKRSPDDILQERSEQLKKIMSEPFDIVVTELFPFGRNKFKKEILTLIDQAREANPRVHVSCSIRDILVEKADSKSREQKMIDIVGKYYDSVMVHSDERILTFGETFSKANLIESKLAYTGFVTEGKKASKSPTRNNDIIVSMGGGIVGEEMVRAVLAITPNYPQYKFRFVPGPYAPDSLKKEIKKSAEASPNIVFEVFLNNFEEELGSCALSISLAGYNTVMNLLNTETPAVVYPYMANIEQNLRATKLQERNLLEIIYLEDLAPEKLSFKINKQLQEIRPKFEVNLDGSKNTTLFLLSKIGEKR